MNLRRFVVTHLAVSIVLLAGQGLAQTPDSRTDNSNDPFAAKHRELAAENPEGLSFSLQLKNHQNKFHPGEIIPLELSFASSLPDTYVLDNANYDRSGRLDMDTFVIDRPNDAVDPLHEYYESAMFGFMGGGLRGIEALDSKPRLINYELNEWLRLNKPGKYRLYVLAGRITKGKPHHFGNTPVRPASNIVEFEILPRDEEWDKQKLAEAVKLIDSNPKASGYPNEPGRAGCRTLRFLDTEASIKEIIRRFRGEAQTCDFEYDFGLLGTSRQNFAVTQMERAVYDPDQPIIGYFLNTLTFLAFQRDNPGPLPPYPMNDEAAQKLWQAQMTARRHAFEQVKQKYATQLAIAVKDKQRRAAALSIDTLAELRISNLQGDEGMRFDIAESLAKVFFDLPVEKQRALVEYQWSMISGPAMLPVLRELYQHPPDMHEIPQPFPGLALLRIYQLAPEEGRQLILDEIGRPDSRVRSSILSRLPDKALPQLEDTIVARAIDQRDDNALALVSRYVSAAALPQLRVAFEHQIGRMACAEQESLINYFLRADQAFGLQMIQKALSSRKNTHCYPNVLTSAAGDTITPEFEAIAVENLNDPDAEVVFSAVRVLCSHGSLANKPKIVAAIKQVVDRLREAKVDPESSSGNGPFPGYLVESMLRNYAMATPWVTASDEFKDLQQLCLTGQCRDQLKPRELTAEREIYFFYFEGLHEERRFAVGYYDSLDWHGLKEKLIQYPKGTKFTWHSENHPRELDQQLFDELQTYLKEKGFELVRVDLNKN